MSQTAETLNRGQMQGYGVLLPLPSIGSGNNMLQPNQNLTYLHLKYETYVRSIRNIQQLFTTGVLKLIKTYEDQRLGGEQDWRLGGERGWVLSGERDWGFGGERESKATIGN